MLTLFGLVLAVGIVVDDAIVVVENVERKIERGPVAARGGARHMDEVGAALIAIALVLSRGVHADGLHRRHHRPVLQQFAVTIATATIISAFNSLTLQPGAVRDPAEAARATHQQDSLLMRPVHAFFRLFNRAFDMLAATYARVVRARHRARWPSCWCVYALLLGAAVWLVMHTPTGFIPKMDRGYRHRLRCSCRTGASLQRTDEVVARANKIVLETPGVAHTSTYTGRSGDDRLQLDATSG